MTWGSVLLNRPSSSDIRPLSFVQQPADLRKHLVQHPLSQPPGLGILTAGVVGDDQGWQRGLQAVAGSVLEAQAGQGCALLPQQPPVAVEGDPAQSQGGQALSSSPCRQYRVIGRGHPRNDLSPLC
jgi:hypothetical protein